MTLIDLATLTVADFDGRRTETFRVQFDDAAVSITLDEAKRLGAGEREGGAFSLLFSGPAEPLLSQGIYQLSDAAGQVMELFLVPVGQDGDACRYEAVFT